MALSPWSSENCPTCELIEPVLAQLAARGALSVYTQDDPASIHQPPR
jgi:thiol-disulfide isomerase/thioredoxin